MLPDCRAKEGAIHGLKENWEEDPVFTVIMGTKRFGASFKNIPILYALFSHFRIAPRVVREYKNSFATMMQLLGNYFERDRKVGASYDYSGFDLDNIALSIESVKALWQKMNIEAG